jgi:hypothetical protein
MSSFRQTREEGAAIAKPTMKKCTETTKCALILLPAVRDKNRDLLTAIVMLPQLTNSLLGGTVVNNLF